MDIVNTQIGQLSARESASALNDRSFISSNLVGLNTGASQYTKSENAAVIQQVRNAEKSSVKLPADELSDKAKKLKANRPFADTMTREENVSFSQSLSNISELLHTNGTKLSFILDETADMPVVVVSDRESGNVIRQIPTEEVQQFAQRLKELESFEQSNIGLMFDRKA